MIAAVIAAVGVYFYDAGRVLLPATAAGGSPVTAEQEDPGRDPAYRHYLIRQVWRDWHAVLRAAVPKIVHFAQVMLAAVTRALLLGWQGLFLFPVWLALAGGIVLAAVPLAVVGVVLAAVHLVIVGVGLSAWLLCLLVLRGVEHLFLLTRRILQACPHEGCYARLALPVYACPDCGARHRRLTPNLDGAARHVCRCGARLPTTVPLGRYRLQAYCPDCARPLPHRIGRARVESLPFVGGPDAGKTTFMVLAINAISGAVEAAGGRASFTVRGDEIAFRRLGSELSAGSVSKTGTALPTATMLDVTLPVPMPRNGNRILYLFDPSGEHYTGASRVEAMGYLAHGEALLLIIDPFALPAVQEGLSADERRVLEEKGVVFSPEDPADTFQRVRNELAARADGGRQERVAVVVTKADLLRGTRVGAGVDDLPAWFANVGLGNMVRDLTRTAGEVRYLASGLPADLAAVAALLGWLTGLPLNGAARSAAEAADGADLSAEDPRRPWTPSRRDPRLVPLGYLIARWAIFISTILLSLAALALLLAASAAALLGVLP
ncbi:hypothetical protein AB0K60_10635 [Thermopolyspora sp. NPDC052614]|uniref:TRAFAC clade GTPase domain-containing protein n=1 Tax=Thermopolyspora sp. NPDC052614 TaxID=3155682 RepID=UPI003431DBB2